MINGLCVCCFFPNPIFTTWPSGGVNHGGGSSEDMDASYLISGTSASSIQNGLDMDGSRLYTGVGSYKAMRCARGKCSQAVEATIQLALTDVRNPFMGRLGHFRRKDKVCMQLL